MYFRKTFHLAGILNIFQYCSIPPMSSTKGNNHRQLVSVSKMKHVSVVLTITFSIETKHSSEEFRKDFFVMAYICVCVSARNLAILTLK